MPLNLRYNKHQTPNTEQSLTKDDCRRTIVVLSLEILTIYPPANSDAFTMAMYSNHGDNWSLTD